MTQALLNNLNNLEQKVYSIKNDLSQKMSIPDDFAKVLERKNEVNNSQNNKEDLPIEDANSLQTADLYNNNVQNTDKDAETTVEQAEHTSEQKSEYNQDNKQESKPTKTDLTQLISDAVIEIAGETALEGYISNMPANELLVNNENSEDVLIDETTDNTITEEDSTMYNKEDLISSKMTDSQIALAFISQVRTNSTSDNDIDSGQDVSTVTKESDLSSSVLKILKIKDEVQNNTEIQNYVREDEENLKTESQNKSFIDEKIAEELNIEIIQSETATDDSSNDLMQNQSPQEQVLKAILRGDIKFDDNAIKTIATTQEIQPNQISSEKIIEQISKQLENMYNSSKVNIVLNPESLGKVSLQIINTKEGLSAQFTVTTNEARNLLMKGLEGLKENLLANGINVDNVSVKLSETEESQYNQDWTEQEGSRGGNKQGHPQKQKDDKKHFEQMMFEINNSDKL